MASKHINNKKMPWRILTATRTFLISCIIEFSFRQWRGQWMEEEEDGDEKNKEERH